MQNSYFYFSYFGSFCDTYAIGVKFAGVKASYRRKSSDLLVTNTFYVQGNRINNIRAT